MQNPLCYLLQIAQSKFTGFRSNDLSSQSLAILSIHLFDLSLEVSIKLALSITLLHHASESKDELRKGRIKMAQPLLSVSPVQRFGGSDWVEEHALVGGGQKADEDEVDLCQLIGT